jgi:endo-1,4-beta-xylanase
VPAAQRYGITVWNLTDADSWIVLSGKQDFPALFNSSYQKKPAFSGFVQGLK